MLIRKDHNFISCFNENTGEYIRSGIIENGKDTGVEPFMASFPELLDVGIMGHCIHGMNGLCMAAGVECYQDGLHRNMQNMSVEDFYAIVEQCKGQTYQIALGGCGDPDQHENFEEILQLCSRNRIVPNFTTSGYGMTEEIAKLCKRYCGAVAVSWYRSEYTIKAIEMLIKAGVKTNIHYVLHSESIGEALQRLKEKSFPEGVNAVIFLLHKPIGLGTYEKIIRIENGEFKKFIKYVTEEELPYKIGFDSCTVPALLQQSRNIDVNSIDTCEGARWSAYISADMKMMPCSFDNQEQRWAVDLRNHSIKEAWNSNEFHEFRSFFAEACQSCKRRIHCMGGCPICPEIVLCEEKQKDNGVQYEADSNRLLVVMDEEGNKIVVIPQILFKGKRSISWKEVEKYLIRYIGRIFEVSETDDLILIDKTFVDEYTGSEYTKKLVGALPKIKANMSQGIPEMIEIATGKRWKEDFDNKHKNRAGNGWFRYNTRFAMPVTNGDGEIIEYNIYQAVLIVRYSKNGKLYLYDVQNIKKETRYPSWTNMSDGQKPAPSEGNCNAEHRKKQG